MKKIKIGQIGVCHEHASVKINTLRLLPDVFELVGVVDDRRSTAVKFAGGDLTPYDGLKWLTEEELFAQPGLQAVTIETPNDDLVPTAIRCMERGLPMHMDKPGGRDLALFKHLVDGCAARKIPFQMGYMFRGNPAFQWCLKAVRSGWLGNIFEFQGNMSHDYGGETYQNYLAGFPGGIMFNLGCHLIDFAVALLGRPERVIPFLKSAPGDPANSMNNCLAVLEYPHATATLRACSREVNGISQRRLKICGTKGTVDLCPLERFDGKPLLMNLTLSEGNEDYPAGTHVVDFGVKRDRYEAQLLEFARLVNGEMVNPYSREHDYLVQEVLLAASKQTQWRP
ncbi:MAG: Gfo/Idh/MocA family oxidoreductase [Kiritimatiellae bacterium]|nr:Gfo/Idh/MocA family oxidoreductase [Kiritimatiellia bacterium]